MNYYNDYYSTKDNCRNHKILDGNHYKLIKERSVSGQGLLVVSGEEED